MLHCNIDESLAPEEEVTMTKANTTGNPFLDQDFSDFFNVRKYAEQFPFAGMPFAGVDSSALIETQRKNLEAMTQANRVAFEGAQAIMQRQSEIARQAMDDAVKAVQQVSAAGTAEERVTKQTEFAKQAFESSLRNARELTEMGSKSNGEAIELLNKRVSESFDELRSSLQDIVRQSEKAGASLVNGNGGASKRK